MKGSSLRLVLTQKHQRSQKCLIISSGESLVGTLIQWKYFMSVLHVFHGEQGWCSGESARLPPMCPGFDSRTRRHMWAEFVGSLLCSERFFSGNSGFPLPSKTNIWFDLFDLQSPQLVQHSCSARMIWDSNKVIIIIIIHDYYYYYYYYELFACEPKLRNKSYCTARCAVILVASDACLWKFCTLARSLTTFLQTPV